MSETTLPAAAAATETAIAPDVADVLDSAGLTYSSDREPGIRRLGFAPRFRYVDARNRAIDDAATL